MGWKLLKSRASYVRWAYREGLVDRPHTPMYGTYKEAEEEAQRLLELDAPREYPALADLVLSSREEPMPIYVYPRDASRLLAERMRTTTRHEKP